MTTLPCTSGERHPALAVAALSALAVPMPSLPQAQAVPRQNAAQRKHAHAR